MDFSRLFQGPLRRLLFAGSWAALSGAWSFGAPAPRPDPPSPQASPAQVRTQAQPDWDAIWRRLWIPATTQSTATEIQRLATDLRAVLGDSGDADLSAPRARILDELLNRLEGRPATGLRAAELGLAAPDFAQDFDAHELWLAAEVLEAGQARVALVLAALERIPTEVDCPLISAHINLAWRVGVEEARAGRHAAGALPIQRRLHARYPGSWSATDLALTLGLLGRSTEADMVLATEIAREEAQGAVDPELWNRRGLIALGVRHERRARNYLGRALRLGSSNSAVVLARLDLLRGDLEGARRGFRALSWGPDPGAWTQRGYGLALLPPRPFPERFDGDTPNASSSPPGR